MHLAAPVGGDPLTTLREPVQWLCAQTVSLAVGLLLGAGLARWMGARGFHWSWALVVLAAILLARRLLPWPESAAIASASAARTCRRWRREDVESGTDLRARAYSERTPVDAARAVLRRASGICSAGAGVGAAIPASRDRRLMLGYDERGRSVNVAVAEGRHGLVVGATGSGKTVTQTAIAAHAIVEGSAAVVLDPKGDQRMRRCLREAARRACSPFAEWLPNGPSVYNPYARGSETEIADKLLAGERFTEPALSAAGATLRRPPRPGAARRGAGDEPGRCGGASRALVSGGARAKVAGGGC
jgi:hypothetical protein